MEKVLQELVFPDYEKFRNNYKLFYQGPQCAMIDDADGRCLFFGTGMNIDFATYLNGLPLNKWSYYTDLKQVKLSLEMKGDFIVILCGYTLQGYAANRKEFFRKEYHLSKKGTIEFEYPCSKEDFLAFEVVALDRTYVYGGKFIGSYDAEENHTVDLSIATTTFKKEDYIRRNVRLIRDNLIHSDDECAGHIYVHVVDNGRTLKDNDLDVDNEYIFRHPNPNVGGSGGFARGMIESAHQKNADITHVLLMDDDVLVLPESIRRTYTLLTVLKWEFRNYYISGAMLDFDQMMVQREDIGTVQRGGFLKKAKPDYHVDQLVDVLLDNVRLCNFERPYAAWWYCCMPMSMIKKNGLPMPFFIRSDDVEYGVRSHTGYISMSGICVWHMGFGAKYNALMNMYQANRNLLIAQASSDDFNECNFLGALEGCFRERIKEINYDGAELCCLALEDFMKGPDFISRPNGEEIVKNYSILNEKLTSVYYHQGVDVFWGDFDPKIVFSDNRSVKAKVISRLTENGNRLIAKEKIPTSIGVVQYDGRSMGDQLFMHQELLAVNPYECTASLRKMNRERYKELNKRFEEDKQMYFKKIPELTAAYHKARKHFISESFWRSYLGI